MVSNVYNSIATRSRAPPLLRGGGGGGLGLKVKKERGLGLRIPLPRGGELSVKEITRIGRWRMSLGVEGGAGSLGGQQTVIFIVFISEKLKKGVWFLQKVFCTIPRQHFRLPPRRRRRTGPLPWIFSDRNKCTATTETSAQARHETWLPLKCGTGRIHTHTPKTMRPFEHTIRSVSQADPLHGEGCAGGADKLTICKDDKAGVAAKVGPSMGIGIRGERGGRAGGGTGTHM